MAENTWTRMAKALSAETKKNARISADDYVKDGLLHCGKCGGKKQTRINLFGEAQIVYCVCPCEAERLNEEAKKQETMTRSARLRAMAFPDSQMSSRTFLTSEPCKIISVAEHYVENWETMQKKGRGLLLYGENSRGKTHAAACIVNALIDKGVPAMLTNFERLINQFDAEWQSRQSMIDSLSNYRLLAIDDLGAERFDPRKRGVIYSIIDARAMTRLPMIVTTNLTAEEMNKPATPEAARIYERIFECCHPVKVDGPNRRRAIMRSEASEMNELLGLKEVDR